MVESQTQKASSLGRIKTQSREKIGVGLAETGYSLFVNGIAFDPFRILRSILRLRGGSRGTLGDRTEKVFTCGISEGAPIQVCGKRSKRFMCRLCCVGSTQITRCLVTAAPERTQEIRNIHSDTTGLSNHRRMRQPQNTGEARWHNPE